MIIKGNRNEIDERFYFGVLQARLSPGAVARRDDRLGTLHGILCRTQ